MSAFDYAIGALCDPRFNSSLDDEQTDAPDLLPAPYAHLVTNRLLLISRKSKSGVPWLTAPRKSQADWALRIRTGKEQALFSGTYPSPYAALRDLERLTGIPYHTALDWLQANYEGDV